MLSSIDPQDLNAKPRFRRGYYTKGTVSVRTLELEHAKDKSVKTESACEDFYSAKRNGQLC